MGRQRRGATVRLVLLIALASVAAAPSRADWLMTREGARIETRGAWEVKGKLVVFHTPKGALSSLRLSEVDLEASRRETARAELAQRAAEEARKQPPEKKASVLVLTDDKVRHVEPGAAPAAAVAAKGPSFTVATWERAADSGDGHVVITGTLRNVSGAQASDITLTVQLLDAEGHSTATGQAILTATSLDIGEQSGFRVEFPGASTFTDVLFEPKAVIAAAAEPVQPPAAVPPPAEDESAPAEQRPPA